MRPPIPKVSGHPIQFHPASDSGVFGHPCEVMLRGDLPPAIVRVFLTWREPDEEIADAQDTRRFTSIRGGSVDPPDFSQPVDWADDPSGLSRARSQCRCALALTGDAHRH